MVHRLEAEGVLVDRRGHAHVRRRVLPVLRRQAHLDHALLSRCGRIMAVAQPPSTDIVDGV